MSDTKPILTLITSHYPCLISGDFFEDSIPYLQNEFTVRVISIDTQNYQTRNLPKNVVYTRMPEQTRMMHELSKISIFFRKIFWEQIQNFKKTNCLSLKMVSRILTILSKSYHLARYLKSQQEFSNNIPKIYYSFFSNDYLLAPIIVKRSSKKNIKAIARCRGIDINRFEQDKCFELLMGLVDKNIDSIYFDCEDRKKYFMKKYANKPTDPFKYIVANFGTWSHDKNNAGDDTLRILTRTPQDSEKSVIDFIFALAQVKKGKVAWTHIGDESNVKRIADEQLSLNENITYTFTGDLSYAKRIEYCNNNSFDCIFYLSHMRALPFEIIEAMSYGIFTVALNIGGINELINSENGLLLPEDIKTEELTSVIEIMATLDRNAINEKCNKAKETFLDYCTAENNCKALSENLLELLKD